MATITSLTSIKDIPSTPSTGKFYWKEETNTLEWISNTPITEKSGAGRKKGARQGTFVQDVTVKSKQPGRRTPSAGARPLTGRKNYLPREKSPKHGPRQANQIEENAVVELQDVKNVAFKMVSEVQVIALEFEEVVTTDLIDSFILSLLRYFYLFFEKSTLENKPKAMYIEQSREEVAAYDDVCAKMKVSEKFIGAEYCRMVLGIDMEDMHHMGAGTSRVSATYSDRRFYESLYHFCTFVIWIAFKRKDYEGIRRELGRILRSDTFNPAIRVKNVPPLQVDEDGNEVKTKEPELTPAEYRRLHPKRPAIKTIVTQRSPVVVSIMPSPKEDANYLFDRRTGILKSKKSKSASSGFDQEVDNEKYMQELALEESGMKLGIIGDSLSLYNQQTLAPLGADTDEEERENVDEKKESGNAEQNDVVRQPTAISTATTGGGLTDDDEDN